jgi:hypothetical protein
MKYSVVKSSIAERHGVKLAYHNLSADKTRVVVNENELRRVNTDIEKAASMMGGEVLSLEELKSYILNSDNKWN